MNFLYLLGVNLWCAFKGLPWSLISSFLVSLFVAFLYWLTKIILGFNLDFVFEWWWLFLIIIAFGIIWDFSVDLILNTISSFRLMKKFSVSAKSIGIAVSKFGLLSEKKIKKGSPTEFNRWYTNKCNIIENTNCPWKK